jgi:uncharacterized membrane protein
MPIGLVGDLITLIGDAIIAYAVITVHDRMREEHTIDDKVYRTMITERRWIILGVLLIFLGFSFRVIERILE